MPPEAARRLRALDAALAGEPVGAELSELRDLALDIRADRSVPAAEFARALDARAAAGFPKPTPLTPSKAPHRLPRRRAVPLALGTASAVFILVTVGVTSGLFSGGGGQSTGGTANGGAAPGQPQASPEAAAGKARALPLPAQRAPAPGTFPSNAPVRKVERAATITLSAPRDEIEKVSDGVIRTADRYGGFVLSSRVSSGDQDAGASIDLRIPSSRLQPAIADLSKLAHVKARSQSALDITDRFSAPRRALADATAERRALLTQLARAVTPNETASIRARLKLANDRINAARATLRRLGNRVGYSAVSVTVEQGARAAGGSWSVGDAFGDALAVLGVAAGVLVIGLAVLLPVTVMLALAWAARRTYLRRARNAALNAVEKPATR
jgi:hypothetical protein